MSKKTGLDTIKQGNKNIFIIFKEGSFLDPYLLGNAIRYLRKEQGKNLEDLADKCISISTISKIERGSSNTQRLDHLLSKLGVTQTDLEKVIQKIQQEEHILLMTLRSAESQIRHAGSCSTLKQIQMDPKHRLQPYLNYLLGKHHLRGNFQTATYYFEKAIDLANKLRDYDVRLNIPALSYLDLGLLSYQNNNIQLSLHYTEKGMDSFFKGGERTDIFNVLQYNRALFLYQLGNIERANGILDSLYSRINSISRIQVRAQVYELKALICLDQKEYEKGKKLCDEAIQLSHETESADVSCNIWTTIGLISSELKCQLINAENCFLTALSFEKSLKRRNKIALAYMSMGKLYIKLDRLEEAKRNIEKGISIAEKHNDMLLLVDGLESLAYYWSYLGDIDHSIELYQRALHISNKHNFIKKTEKIKTYLSKLERRDDHVQHTRSRGVLNKCLANCHL